VIDRNLLVESFNPSPAKGTARPMASVRFRQKTACRSSTASIVYQATGSTDDVAHEATAVDSPNPAAPTTEVTRAPSSRTWSMTVRCNVCTPHDGTVIFACGARLTDSFRDVI